MKDGKFVPVDAETIEKVLQYTAAIGEAVRKHIMQFPLEDRFFVGSLISAALIVESDELRNYIVSLLNSGQAIRLTIAQAAVCVDIITSIKKETARIKDDTLN